MNIPATTATAPEPIIVTGDWPAEVARLRQQGPVARIGLADAVPAWLVLDSVLIEQVMLDERVFSKDLRRHWPPLRDGLITAEWPLYPWPAGVTMLTTDGAEHRRLRDPARAAFTLAGLEALSGRLDVAVERLCARLARTPDGEIVDLRTEFADEIPIQAICLLLGVQAEHATRLRACAAATLDPTLSPQQAANFARMYETVAALLAFERAHPREKREDGAGDLTTALLAAHEAGTLTEQELADTVVLIVVAGVETTSHLLDHAMHTLLTRPRLRTNALHGEVAWRAVIEEVLRSQPPLVHMPFRVATEDNVLGGVSIAAGELVLVSLGAAGRDPHAHPDPDTFDPARTERHLSFGHGVHRCLGEPLARRIALIAVPQLMQRFPDMSLAVDPAEIDQRRSGIVNGHTALPVHLGRPESCPLTYEFSDGHTRRFLWAPEGQPPVELLGVATDLYRTSNPTVCRHCPAPGRWETRTTIVYRVHDPALPWYVAAEIHRCRCGHSVFVRRAVAAIVGLVEDRDRAAYPDELDEPVRDFVIAPLHGEDQPTLVRAREVDSDWVCTECHRYYGLAFYEIIDDRAPVWLDAHGINRCGGCGSTVLAVHARSDHGLTDAADPPTPQIS